MLSLPLPVKIFWALAPTDMRKSLVYVDAFEISRTEVTNDEYRTFVRETGARPPIGWAGDAPPAPEEAPKPRRAAKPAARKPRAKRK